MYVAEQFENDGSPVSTIVKGVKRAMAGEYSRELSTKVFAGQCRLIELGFRQGGPAGFGLRRVLIDQSGQIKAQLSFREHKSLQTDRVILMPGPPEEVEIVNDMFRWLIRDDMRLSDIAGRLNGMRVTTDLGRRWNAQTVRQVLTNEKYVGNNIFNRQSFKLKKQRIDNPPEMWIRKVGAFEGIVPIEIFFTAQQILIARATQYSDQELLDKLRRLYQIKGWLTGLFIDEAPDLPSAATYSSRFGSLSRAYEMVGFAPLRSSEHLEVNRRLRRLHPQIIERTQTSITELGGSVWRDPKTDLLHVNQELVVSLVMARCYTLPNGRPRWRILFDQAQNAPDITVAIRLDHVNQAELDYFVLPKLDLPLGGFQLSDSNRTSFDCFRFDDLSFFYGMSQRQRVQRPV